ncbi:MULTISPECIES: hypothetical protein [unclassified Streptomyces]|uniref:hypothetical protein n=1 Tax=unclassified Streptomyces TaxID=2593676 RepID=UPI00380650DE
MTQDKEKAQQLRAEARALQLTNHELERFVEDLFQALDQIVGNGARHRGIKPDSLGIQRRKGRPRQLKLFDFSLTDASDRDVKAGTCGYAHRLEAKALFRETHGRGRKAKRISTGFGPGALFEVSPMVGEVLLGAGSPLRLTQRAVRSLSEARGHLRNECNQEARSSSVKRAAACTGGHGGTGSTPPLTMWRCRASASMITGSGCASR